jgi:hypothetical protein
MSFIQSLVQKLGLKSAGTLEERKAQYLEVLMQAMEDGVLTDDEIEELDQLRKDLGLKDDDIKAMRMKAFQKAVEVVKSDGLFTPKEERDLEKIKGYLGVGETDVARNRTTLAKMRVLYEVQRGNLPIDEIAGLGLEPGEQTHVSVGATLHEPAGATRVGAPGSGPVIKAGAPYKMGAGRIGVLPEAELTQAATGAFTITNRRVMFNSGKVTFRYKYEKLVGVTIFADGFVIASDTGEPRIVKLNDRKDLELIAAIISRYLNPPPPKPEGPPRPASPGSSRPGGPPRRP